MKFAPLDIREFKHQHNDDREAKETNETVSRILKHFYLSWRRMVKSRGRGRFEALLDDMEMFVPPEDRA
ncbi:hypothetical protein KIN20_009000 [Parelaphostrongylus tenuis]|uniref:Uncharacterized protein n=1 Tax=Parelaphostrongylus tenuis TaxID=148309 RepID=A0AAD5MR71_PARTN|nr:hypothetical protein KIN20_009000 [Parelaphostrongylus tenuis]